VNVSIERIRLRLPEMSRDDGRRLAELLGRGLSAAPDPPADDRPEGLRLVLDARPGEAVPATADRIVAALARSLTRAP